MILPENGSVVIIDDQPNEALPIIQALSKKGIAVTYYQGNSPDFLPQDCSQIVRLVFLDLQLLDTVDENQISKSISNVLQKIIAPDNGPYILVVWSKNRTQYEQIVLSEIEKFEHLVPSCIIGFNKRDCFDEELNFLIEPNELVEKVLEKLSGRYDEDDIDFISDSIRESLNDYIKLDYIPKQNAFDIIENHIKEQLKKAGVFHLFIIWENLIRKSGSHLVNNISSTIKFNDLWENNMRNIIKRMGTAKTGKNVISDDLSLKHSLSTFTYSFSEELESSIRSYNFPDYMQLTSPFIIASYNENDKYEICSYQDGGKTKIKLLKNGNVFNGKENINPTVITSLSNGLPEVEQAVIKKLVETYVNIPPKINTKLHIELNPSKELMPGNVFKIEIDNQKKQSYLSTYFDKIDNDLDFYTFIELEVSPICDYAQTKWKKSRLISGVIYPYNVSANSSKDHLYIVEPSIIIENQTYKMVFDHHLFKSLDKEIVEKRPVWFRLKRELLIDITTKLSGHVNRPGISFVS